MLTVKRLITKTVVLIVKGSVKNLKERNCVRIVYSNNVIPSDKDFSKIDFSTHATSY